MRQPLSLALKELRHDWRSAACFVAALIGVLAPLLIILALKNGVITTMLDRLVADPANRELIAIGAGKNDATFFDTLAVRDDVAFIVPATRSINAIANAVRHTQARKLVRKVPMIPSAQNDPLSPNASVGPGQVLLSDKLATALSAQVGTILELRIDRRINDAQQTGLRDLTVAGILPADRYSREAMFISLDDLLMVEAFRDDPTLTVENWAEPRPRPTTFASFRLYAKDLRDMAGLESALENLGVNARPRAENVDLLISVQRSTNTLFAVIAGLALAGFWAAMAANLRGTVERQRVSLSLLRLLGLPERARRVIPTFQSIVLVALGIVATLLFVLPTLAIINAGFTPEGFDRIAQLKPSHLFGTFVVGLFTAITASFWAMSAIGDITSDEVLRSG